MVEVASDESADRTLDGKLAAAAYALDSEIVVSWYSVGSPT